MPKRITDWCIMGWPPAKSTDWYDVWEFLALVEGENLICLCVNLWTCLICSSKPWNMAALQGLNKGVISTFESFELASPWRSHPSTLMVRVLASPLTSFVYHSVVKCISLVKLWWQDYWLSSFVFPWITPHWNQYQLSHMAHRGQMKVYKLYTSIVLHS